MSCPWLSDDYKRSPKSRSKSPEAEKRRTKIDEFGRSVPVKSRSRSRSRSRESRRRSPERVRGRPPRESYRPSHRDREGRRDYGDREDYEKPRKRRRGSKSEDDDGSPEHVRLAASTKPKYMNSRVFVANINSREVKKDELSNHFQKYGQVADLLIHPKNYAFVQYLSIEEAKAAVEGENGNTFQGSRMDVKLASEGKRDSTVGKGIRGRGRGRGGGYFNDNDREWSADHHDNYYRPGGHRMPPPPFRDEFGMRDPYYPPPPPGAGPYMRGYPDPWMPGHDDFYRHDPYGEPYRDAFPAKVPPPPAANVECEIFVVSSSLRDYGQAIENRVKEHSIITAVTVMPEGRTASSMLVDLTERNGLFAVFVNAQNETHRSLTLNILHGTPQEHRNMPMNDAITLIGRSFEQYVETLREKAKTASSAGADKPAVGGIASRIFLPPSSEVTYLLNLLADNRALTIVELNDVIKYLKERRDKLLDAESRPLASDEASLVRKTKPAETQKMSTAEEITNKILSIFSSAGGNLQGVIPPNLGSAIQQQQRHHQPEPPVQTQSPSPVKLATSRPSQPQPTTSSTASNMIDFDNPNVQKALDNLIQSSPALLQSLGSSSSSGSSAAAPRAPSLETVSRVVGHSSMIGYGGAHGSGQANPPHQPHQPHY